MSASTSTAGGIPVAVVGIGCRFPGGVVDPASFWRLLDTGTDAIREIPADRIDLARHFDPRPATPGRIMSRWGGFLDHIDELDAAFFGISPREAGCLDPQQRLVLETAWEALEDAGQDARQLDGTRTGVFLGQWLSDFEGRLFADPEAVDFYTTTGTGRYAASGRLSYVLGLRGPSLTVDTACSSSLVAVHLAVASLRSGESVLAIAGGVNVILQPHITIAYSQSLMMAPDGRCKFGDASGDGYVRSEGAGMVVLKPLARALADGDRVYAVIRGSAVNNDGRSSGSMGTPSRIGQEELLRLAYRDAGLAPGRVGYVEGHGTGTRAGDPVELGALGAVLAEQRAPESRAYVGSVKTNFGHTEGAAGVAGLIKVALSLHHGAIPASLHCREPNPAVSWADTRLAIPGALTPWPEPERVAGVSGFGIAGTNAHVVLTSVDGGCRAAPVDGGGHAAVAADATGPHVLPLSARSPEALGALAGRYAELLANEAGLHAVCIAAATRRTPLEHRAAFVAADRVTMVDALRRFAAGDPASASGVVPREARPKLAFVVPGQGAQSHGMARELLAREAVFRDALERCDRAARPHGDWSIVEQLRAEPGAPGYRLDEIDVIQPVLVALAIAYAALWESLGVRPAAVVGHSMGEVGAAHLAGVLDLEQAMRIVCHRSLLMRRTSGQGAMALVELSLDEARARIAGRERQISVAVSNSPRSSVLSGDPDAIAHVLAELERDQVFCRLVKVDVASHSPQMEPLAVELAAALDGLVPGEACVPIVSTVLGRLAEGRAFGPAHWAKNLRQPVLFADSIQALVEDGVDVFVELGPHPILLPSLQQTAQALGRPITTLACGRRDEPERASLLAALAGLWAAGVAVDWRKAMPGAGRAVQLPLYPWQRERHWAEAAELGSGTPQARRAGARPDDESLGWLYQLGWEPSDSPAAPAAGGGWLVLAGDQTTGSALAAALGGLTAPLDGLEATLARRSQDGVVRGLVVVAGDGPDTAYLPVRILQAVLGSSWQAPPRLWFVTRGAQAVAAKARVGVEQAALWGAARVIAEEHPDLWGGLVDLDPAVEPDAALLSRHLSAADGEDQVAFRSGRRHALRLRPLRREAASARFAWRPDGAYLITGGLGGVGRHIARAMAAEGARRLVLLGRTPLPPREQWSGAASETVAGQRIAAVRELEAAGVAVHTAAVDVGDEDELRTFLDRYASESWPPIRGVVHLAGAFENRLTGEMTRASFDAVVRPKLRGAELLDRLLPDLDLFLTFSSTGAFLPQPGQANYAAANAGLDALAHDRQARGLEALSIGWGVWADTGLVDDEAGARNVAELARQGVRSFSPERGTALFGWLCGRREPGLAVLPLDRETFQRARSGRMPPLFLHLVAPRAAPASALGDRMANADPAERRRLVEGAVRECVSRVLRIAPSRLDPRRALGELGLSSLLAMELRNRLEAALARPLSATICWNYPTVSALVEHLAGSSDPVPAAPPPPTSGASERLTEIAELSDEQAVLALRKGSRPRRAS